MQTQAVTYYDIAKSFIVLLRYIQKCQAYDFIDDDLPAIEESSNDPPHYIMTAVNDCHDNCLPQVEAVEARHLNP